MSEKGRQSSAVWTLEKALPWLLLIAGIIALAASFALTMEKFDLLENPSYVPVCDINPIISCGPVSSSAQAAAFGFPNQFLGLAGYAIVATTGAVLLAGARLKRWFWLSVEVGLFFAIVFVHWLAFETLYRIGSLCIYCMVVWAVTAPMFWYTTLYILRQGHIKTPLSLRKIVGFIQQHHAEILILWYLVIIALIAKRFWYYWNSLI